MSRALYKDYVSPNSSQQINLKAKTFQTLEQNVAEGAFDTTMFNAAKDEVRE
jgi:hypothetical protein